MDPKIAQFVGEGYRLGYSLPEAEPGIPLDEPWMGFYLMGVDAGRAARIDADSQFEGPTIGPDPGGESWDHYQQRWKELFDTIFHEHMPHTEVEMEVPEPPPMNVIR